ncbi:aminoglycoside 6-adenylyltransferase [Mycobacterium pyrenivorans]|nr:aminoglycoside 6-adenylyltransferase [Mycolicibacterium pyrenivorans]
MDYTTALDALVRWAEWTDSVRGVLVTGSAAVGDVHPLSDRDIEIYTHDVESLLEDESWWNGLGSSPWTWCTTSSCDSSR